VAAACGGRQGSSGGGASGGGGVAGLKFFYLLFIYFAVCHEHFTDTYMPCARCRVLHTSGSAYSLKFRKYLILKVETNRTIQKLGQSFTNS
jgi:hypothetical protein